MKKLTIFLLVLLMIPFMYGENEGLKMMNPMTFTNYGRRDTLKNKLPKDSTDWQKYWRLKGILGFNMTQTSFTNWAAGGQNNATGILYVNLDLDYHKNYYAWEAHLNTEFGQMFSMAARDAIDDLGNTYRTRWRKSSDKIEFTTKFGFEFQKRWFVTAQAGFKSQYARGFDYDKFDKNEDGFNAPVYTSNWLSPSYSDLSIGIDWKPKDFLSFYLSPIAGRIVSCTDSLLRKSYGVDIDKTFQADLGMTFKAKVNYSYKNLSVISELVLYTPYTSKKQRFGNFDVDWDFSISYQFLKVFNVRLNTTLKYYDQVMITTTNKNGETRIGARVQFKEILGIGIGYQF